MNNINLGRVVLGGLVAGLVLGIGEFLLDAVVLEDGMATFNAAHNFKDPTGGQIGIVVALTFVLGIVIVLGYAAIRPRFGPGVKTAILAALFAWFGIYFFVGILFLVFFGISTGDTVLSLVWGLVEYSLATVAGAARCTRNSPDEALNNMHKWDLSWQVHSPLLTAHNS